MKRGMLLELLPDGLFREIGRVIFAHAVLESHLDGFAHATLEVSRKEGRIAIKSRGPLAERFEMITDLMKVHGRAARHALAPAQRGPIPHNGEICDRCGFCDRLGPQPRAWSPPGRARPRSTSPALASVPTSRHLGRMTDHDQLREPGTPEWTVALALRTGLRRHLGPRHGYVLAILAGEIVTALRLAGWRLVKEPPDAPATTPGE